jgi:hypothetical protein
MLAGTSISEFGSSLISLKLVPANICSLKVCPVNDVTKYPMPRHLSNHMVVLTCVQCVCVFCG